MALHAINKNKLRDQLYDDLKSAILTGEFEQGSKLTIGDVSSLTGVSSTPIREALLKLEQDELVKRSPSGGFIVRQYSKKEVEDLIALRAVLESYAVSMAIEHINAKEIAWLEKNLKGTEECSKKGQMGELSGLNAAFHNRINSLSGNIFLNETLLKLSYQIGMIRSAALWQPGQAEVSTRDHRDLLNALKMRDKESAKKIVKRHLQNAREIIMAAFAVKESSQAIDE
jgi:DNA-binding GntR family transcriptional regulator